MLTHTFVEVSFSIQANLACRVTLRFQGKYSVLCSFSFVGIQCSECRRKCHQSVSERLEFHSVLMRMYVCTCVWGGC